MNPAFGIYGQFIASIPMVLGFFIARGSSKYSEPLEKELHQEKVYNLVKRVLETKFLSESEKEKLYKELEVISLRLKGTAFLKSKIENSSKTESGVSLIEERDFKEGMQIFQDAINLSSNSQQEIGIKDMDLVKQIFKQQYKQNALYYLNQISNHTTTLIGELFKKLSS